MRTNEKKKYERLAILDAKRKHAEAARRIDELNKHFEGLACRYRKGNMWCHHPRFTMKKYPGHSPQPPLCHADVCPRD